MDSTVKVCCDCQRVDLGDGWKRVFKPVKGDVSHGYCPQCLQKALEDNSKHSYTATPVIAFA